MALANSNNIKQTLNITSDIYNIIMKNRVIINKYNQQQLDNSSYYRNLYKNKSFEDVIRPQNTRKLQFFCTDFCGENINDCACLHRTL
jgi:hypothetical protein